MQTAYQLTPAQRLRRLANLATRAHDTAEAWFAGYVLHRDLEGKAMADWCLRHHYHWLHRAQRLSACWKAQVMAQ